MHINSLGLRADLVGVKAMYVEVWQLGVAKYFTPQDGVMAQKYVGTTEAVPV